MIERITYIEGSGTCPYHNLAVEEYLLLHCQKNQCIIYLWQNANTVVIGRNQNAWKECLVGKLEEENGFLARRLSGGGAVYHDLGNLNFTFLVQKENYNVQKQLEVILKAVQNLGIPAEKSGRNDILADGRKFSGNAFYEQGEHCYHHGTLMVNVNMADLSRYLTVSKEKLQSKGVDSVRSRVTNLCDFVPGLTIEQVKKSLVAAFEEVYGLTAEKLEEDHLEEGLLEKGLLEKGRKEERQGETHPVEDPLEKGSQGEAGIGQIEKRLSSWEWLFGQKIKFQHELRKRFAWGDITLQVEVERGKILDVAVYSDAMKPGIILELPRYLKGCRYERKALQTELGLYWSADPQEEEMMKDIVEWLGVVEL